MMQSLTAEPRVKNSLRHGAEVVAGQQQLQQQQIIVIIQTQTQSTAQRLRGNLSTI
jgi:hypothetical protein